jgi:hypothetical protein
MVARQGGTVGDNVYAGFVGWMPVAVHRRTGWAAPGFLYYSYIISIVMLQYRFEGRVQ